MSARIVVVGGGFAGFWAAVAARRVGGDAVSITLVSAEPVLTIRPRLYEAHPETLSVELAPLLGLVGVQFVLDRALGIDYAEQRLLVASGAAAAFDRLVVATGSVMRRPAVPGAELAYSIDTQGEAVDFDRRLGALADQANPSIAVIGAGFTGIELALELRDRVAMHGGVDAGENLRVLLVDRADVVGAELGPGPRPVIEAALAAAGVEVHLGAHITALAAEQVSFADGSTLDVDAVVLTTGLEAGPFGRQLPGERDGFGRIVVDAALRAPAAPQVFVAGDAAAADTGNGQLAAQSCQHALRLGRYAGENAARDLLGMALVDYEQLRYVTCLDLGRSGAVLTEGWERTVKVSGGDAKPIKRRINTELIYPPPGATAQQLLRLSALD